MRTLPPDYAGLQPPQIVEEIAIEAILAGKVTRLNANFAAAGLPYTVSAIAHDPAVVQLQAAAYDEARLRQRINEAARANLLAFATGADLDHLGTFHGLPRMANEDDDRYAYRIVLANRDRNSAGSGPRYELLALTASARVRRAVVYTVGRDPTIHLAVQSTDNDGAADQELLDQVTTAVTATAVRQVNDTLSVEPAVRLVVNVTAKAWLKPERAATVLDEAAAALRAAWAAEGTLGRDLVGSWMARQLHVGGIARLEEITPARTVVPFNEFAAIGTISLQNMGREF